MNRATLIYNPVAGRRPARREGEICAAAGILRQAGLTLDVLATAGPGSARNLAQSAARAGARAVFVCGGDGTINEVVNGLAGSACPLGILPGGTANIAARDLGLPRNPVAAARALVDAKPHRISLGRATWQQPHDQTERYFLSIAGVGFDAYVVHHLSWGFKTALGVSAYAWEAVHQACRYGFPRFVCRRGDDEWRGTQALVQRTERYAGWFHLAPGASLLNDQMSVCVFESSSPWRYLLYTSALGLGRHLALRDVHLTEVSRLTCCPEDSSRRIYVELDGELAGQLPAAFELVPDALTLLLPDRAIQRAARLRHSGPR